MLPSFWVAAFVASWKQMECVSYSYSLSFRCISELISERYSAASCVSNAVLSFWRPAWIACNAVMQMILSLLEQWYCLITLANWHHTPPAHTYNVLIASLFYQMETSSQHPQNRSHFIHPTPTFPSSTSSFPTHSNSVEYTSPISRPSPWFQTSVYETPNLRHT